MAKRDEPIAQLATRRRSGRQRILVSPSPAAPKSPATPTSSAGKTAPAPRGTPRHPTSSAATIRPSLTAHARLHVRTSSVGRMRRHPKAPSSQGPTSSAARTIASRAASGSSRIRTSSAVGTSGTQRSRRGVPSEHLRRRGLPLTKRHVFETAARLVSPPYRLTVAGEQQDGAVEMTISSKPWPCSM